MARICIVSPSLKLGGIERALTTLAKEFQLLGHEIHFMTCLRDDHFYTLPKGIEVYEPSFKRTASFLNKVLYYPRLLKYIRLTIKKIQPDRVLVYGDWFSPITLLALKGTNFPVYISDRTIPTYTFKFPIPQLKSWLYPQSAGFIAQTRRAKEFKEVNFKNKLRIGIIPNALPEFKFQETTREKIILYVGRFAWEKDPEILIRSLPQVFSTFSDWKLVMAGNGPLLNAMKSLVNSLDLGDHVVFLGKVSDVDLLYSRASILVLPSVIEGFPNTLIEGMSAGLPCICFSDIPYEDIITPGLDGIVLKKRVPEELAEAIRTLIEQPKLRNRLGMEARQVQDRFSATKIARNVLIFMKL